MSENTVPRVVSIMDELEDQHVESVISQLIRYNSEDNKAPIHVVLSCRGGSISAGFGLYDLLSMSEAPIITYAVGTVFSAALIIYLAGGERLATPHAVFLAHPPIMVAEDNLSPNNLQSYSNYGLRLTRDLRSLLSSPSLSISPESVEKMLSEDTFFGPEEATAYGITHRVINTWPSGFKQTPKDHE